MDGKIEDGNEWRLTFVFPNCSRKTAAKLIKSSPATFFFPTFFITPHFNNFNPGFMHFIRFSADSAFIKATALRA